MYTNSSSPSIKISKRLCFCLCVVSLGYFWLTATCLTCFQLNYVYAGWKIAAWSGYWCKGEVSFIVFPRHNSHCFRYDCVFSCVTYTVMSSFIFLFIDRHFLRVSPVIVLWSKIAEWTVDKYFDIYITNGT